MIAICRARAYYPQEDSAHGFDHVLRVWRLAERIGREEGADLEVLQAAALLHDVARAEEDRTGVDHAVESARRASEILAGGEPARVARVVEAIAQHRFRGGQRPTTIEARVLYDADKLDAIGAIGVARAYAVAGAHGQHLWADVPASLVSRDPASARGDLADADHTPVHEYAFKLIRLRDGLFTATGRRVADERHRFMVAFFEQLDREVQGLA